MGMVGFGSKNNFCSACDASTDEGCSCAIREVDRLTKGGPPMNYIRVAPAPGMDRRGTLRVLQELLEASSALVFAVSGGSHEGSLWSLYCTFKFAVQAAEQAETEREQNAHPGEELE